MSCIWLIGIRWEARREPGQKEKSVNCHSILIFLYGHMECSCPSCRVGGR